MQIKVMTSTTELAEMNLTADQLKASVLDCLDDHTCGPDGERIDLAGFDVDVEIISTVRVFMPPVSA